MPLFKKFGFAIAVFAAAILPAAEAVIGGVRFDFPEPEGYQDVQRDYPAVMGVFEAFCPPTNRLLAAFVNREEMEQLLAGKRQDIARYYSVQTLRQTENTPVSAEDFAKIAGELRDNLQEMLGANKELLNKIAQDGLDKIGESTAISSLEALPLEIDLDRPDAIAFTMLVNFTAGDLKGAMLCHSVTCILRDRIIYLYSYLQYEGPESIGQVRQMGHDFLEAVSEANRATP